MDEIQVMTANLASQIRKETVDGKEWFVASGVLLIEDVLVANNGALYYPASEIKKSAVEWDDVPLVLNHPMKDGKFVSVHSEPEFIANTELGYVTKSKWNGKLRTEYWIDMEKADKLDPRIRTQLEAGKPIEVSTGLGMTIENKESKFKGKSYVGIAKDYIPDHVAFLLDSKGACDIKAGCGCLTSNSAEAKPLTTNEMSYSRIREQLSGELEKKFGYYAYIRDIYSNFFVYTGKDNQLYKATYSQKDDLVTIGTESPVAVKWVTEYRTMDDAFVGNCSCNFKESDMDKKAIVTAMIANGAWKEDKRAWLESLPDDVLTTMSAQAKPIVANTVAPVVPTPAPKQLDAIEYINSLPVGIREVVMDQYNAGIAAKTQMIANIKAQTKDSAVGTFTDEYLNAQQPDVLRVLVGLTAPKAPVAQTYNYGGQATVPPVLAANQQAPAPTPYVAPAFDFSK